MVTNLEQGTRVEIMRLAQRGKLGARDANKRLQTKQMIGENKNALHSKSAQRK